MIPIKRGLIGCFLIASLVPIGSSEYSNLGVKRRPVGQKTLSKAADIIPILNERAYAKVTAYKPYALAAGARHGIPPITLLAILFEEELHRKPIDVSTFGPAQLGLGELEKQGLPPRVDLLEDPEISTFLLASKLDRLRKVYGSLRTAIILHNGFDDYFTMVERRQKDPRLLQILIENRVRESFVA
jgi:hypothetical protein